MLRSRAARIFEPPPNMRSSAARFRPRWRRPIPGNPRYELADAAYACKSFGDRHGCASCDPPRAADCGTCSGHVGVGASGPAQQYPALCVAGTAGGVAHTRCRLAGAVAIAADDAAHPARRVHCGHGWRHWARAAVQPVEMAGIFAISVRRDPAGHAGHCDCAAASDLSAAANRRHRMRLDRRVLSGAVQHDAGLELGRSQSRRPVSALWRLAHADAPPAQIAVSAAVYPGRLADRGRSVADRRLGRGARRRHRRRRFGPCISYRRIRLPAQYSPNVRGICAALVCRDCHLCPASANFTFGTEALARKCAWKGKLMVSGTISSEKIDLLVHGPNKPIVDNGFSDQFVLHHFETTHDLERLTAEVAAKVRGMAVTYNTVRGDARTLARFPRLEIVSSFGVGYDHIDANYAREHNIVVTNTPDVLTEEVADIALGLLIATLREFIKADRYLRSGLWMKKNFPLSVGSLRDRKVGMVGMGRIGQAIARRLDASRVPVVYHSRKVADGVSYKHYPDLIEMAKAVDTLIVIIPGGAATAKMINDDVMKALGPRGVIINVARGSVVDEPALIAALKSGTILAAGLDVFEKEPNVPDELKALQNVVLLPHIGSASVVTRNAMDQLVVDNLKAWFAGKPPLTPGVETPVKGR